MLSVSFSAPCFGNQKQSTSLPGDSLQLCTNPEPVAQTMKYKVSRALHAVTSYYASMKLPEVESRTQGSRPRPRPRTQKKSEAKAKAKDQGHKAQVLSKKKKKKRSSQKFFRRSPKKKKKKKVFTKISRRSPRKNAFQKIFQPLHKILTFQKIVLSSSRGQANFRGLEASRPRPRPRT